VGQFCKKVFQIAVAPSSPTVHLDEVPPTLPQDAVACVVTSHLAFQSNQCCTQLCDFDSRHESEGDDAEHPALHTCG